MTDAKEPTDTELGAIFHGAGTSVEPLSIAIANGNRAVFTTGREFERSRQAEARGPRPVNPYVVREHVRANAREVWNDCAAAYESWADSGRPETLPDVASEADVERLAEIGRKAHGAAFSGEPWHGAAYHWQCAVRAILAELAKGTV